MFPILLLSDFSCTCGGGDRSKCLKACSIVDGTSLNEGDCGCGSINCNAATGYYCLALSNKCAKMKIAPTCVTTDSSAANSETCTCGSSECDATKGLFCLATSSRCTIFAVGTCDGCKDLVGAKSGIAWDDGEGEGCAAFATNGYCPDYGADDDGEGAANDNW